MASKKQYHKPEVTQIILDKSVSLMMQSPVVPPNPDPRGGVKKGTSEPFQSPFGDKPFN